MWSEINAKKKSTYYSGLRAMGHSSLNVSLNYLRGLEVAELKEKDVPTGLVITSVMF